MDEWFIGSYTRVYEYLIPYIVARFHSKPAELADILVALNRIITFDSLIVLGSYQEVNDFYLIDNISKVNAAIGSMAEIMKQIQSIGESTGSIATIAEEQSAATQEITDHMINIHEFAEKIKGRTHITGELIYRVSIEVDELRKETIDVYRGYES